MDLTNQAAKHLSENTFFNHLKEVFEIKDNEVLDPSAQFKDHSNWSSMTALLTVFMFHSEYNLHVETEELATCHTFMDLFVLIKQKLEADVACTA